MTPRLALSGITKTYPTVIANDRISLDVGAGEIHAVLGENGAGKSTLMKIIAGALRPDAGAIKFDGRAVVINSPLAARRLGITMVHQHFALFDSLTIAENVALGAGASASPADASNELRALGNRYGLQIDPHAHVHDLSLGERQRVEILRALLARPRLLILDEPTSVLTHQAIEQLFATLRLLAADGTSVLFVSHKLDEIRRLARRCTVLRAGRVVATVDPSRESESNLARMMIGADPPQLAAHETAPGVVVLEVDPLARGSRGFALRSGEILGLAGIAGNGQRELMAALSGERMLARETIRLDGRGIGDLNPRRRRALGMRYVPEDRAGHGAVSDLTLTENALLTGDAFSRRGFVLREQAARSAEGVIKKFNVKANSAELPAAHLSGGNLQKFIVGREIDARPRVLIADQPTWGLDVGAAATIRNALVALREEGTAVLIASEELDELFALCDRLMVIANGRLSPAVPAKSITVEEIGRWMAGLWHDSSSALAA